MAGGARAFGEGDLDQNYSLMTQVHLSSKRSTSPERKKYFSQAREVLLFLRGVAYWGGLCLPLSF